MTFTCMFHRAHPQLITMMVVTGTRRQCAVPRLPFASSTLTSNKATMTSSRSGRRSPISLLRRWSWLNHSLTTRTRRVDTARLRSPMQRLWKATRASASRFSALISFLIATWSRGSLRLGNLEFNLIITIAYFNLLSIQLYYVLITVESWNNFNLNKFFHLL